VLEKELERKFVKGIEKIGGKCRKFVSPGWKGAPDRIVLMPGEKIYFVELKKPGKKLGPLQKQRIKELQQLGFKALYLDSIESVNNFLLNI
jgi:hypothetical protein